MTSRLRSRSEVRLCKRRNAGATVIDRGNRMGKESARELRESRVFRTEGDVEGLFAGLETTQNDLPDVFGTVNDHAGP